MLADIHERQTPGRVVVGALVGLQRTQKRPSPSICALALIGCTCVQVKGLTPREQDRHLGRGGGGCDMRSSVRLGLHVLGGL